MTLDQWLTETRTLLDQDPEGDQSVERLKIALKMIEVARDRYRYTWLTCELGCGFQDILDEDEAEKGKTG